MQYFQQKKQLLFSKVRIKATIIAVSSIDQSDWLAGILYQNFLLGILSGFLCFQLR
jgi:hypothetical protein